MMLMSQLYFEIHRCRPSFSCIASLNFVFFCYNFKMPRKFLTEQEALHFVKTLDDSDLDDIDNELVILFPDTNALSETEDIDDSSTREIEEIMCDDQFSTNDTNVHYYIL
ncbi:hypothetical protein AVEN_155472-1 [Araneus ventricosus]|uniref:Uncharacterized protein n=1 Tax=Araneus ventricosus TaxID=182803 RepID=A0A4Y2NLD0_ARAVE|nr:hypothetical protein AVEN_155472-1 [Araneus ventricosus]